MDLIAPLAVQVGLTLVLLFAMAYFRVKAVTAREVRTRDIALRQPNWPEKATRFANCFHNQLETPILFYVLVILLIITKLADSVFLYLAWGFVGIRLLHAYAQVTKNFSKLRFYSFVLSTTILTIMWVRFIIKIFVQA